MNNPQKPTNEYLALLDGILKHAKIHEIALIDWDPEYSFCWICNKLKTNQVYCTAEINRGKLELEGAPHTNASNADLYIDLADPNIFTKVHQHIERIAPHAYGGTILQPTYPK